MTGFEAIRKICHLTLEDVATMLDITRQSVRDWNMRGVPKGRAEQLSKALGIETKFFYIEEVNQADMDSIEQQHKQFMLEKSIREQSILANDKDLTQLLANYFSDYGADNERLQKYKEQFRLNTMANLNSLELVISSCFETTHITTAEDWEKKIVLWKNIYAFTKLLLKQARSDVFWEHLSSEINIHTVLDSAEILKPLIEKEEK